MKKFLIPSLLIAFFVFGAICIAVFLRCLPPKKIPLLSALKRQPLVVENFEPNEEFTRNSGTWIKRDGKINAERIASGKLGYVLRLRYDVKQDGAKFKEAGWWLSLSGMDLRGFSALRFRVALSDKSILFLIGLKNGEWVEQRIWSESFTRRSTPASKWQVITIPLKAFNKIDNWAAMDNLSITFRSLVGNVPRAEILIDDIALVPSGKIAPKGPVPLLPAYPLPATPSSLTDDALLDTVERATFGYFLNEANPSNGLVKDFCRVWSKDHLPVASSAAVGFGLSSLCVGASRGWIPDALAKERILATLKFFRDDAEQEHGFFYHFMDMDSGARWEESEVSSMDTTLLLAGMLTAAHYYPGTEIEKIAKEIYERVDWAWMLNGGRTLSMGWTPEGGFLNIRWADYCELMIIYVLAIGSPTHPIPADCWYQWGRMRCQYDKDTFIGCPPLFTHQYSQIWVDFRGMRDEEADYFDNSIHATIANQKWCIAHKAKFRTYREGFWGLTACDGPTGYMAYGAPYGTDDGTVSPTAAIGSIVFTPAESLGMIRLMLLKLPDKVWGRYGFIDAFNLQQDWFSNKYLGIDEGPILLMIENYRTGLIWKTFMKEPAIARAVKAAKFVENQTSNK